METPAASIRRGRQLLTAAFCVIALAAGAIGYRLAEPSDDSPPVRSYDTVLVEFREGVERAEHCRKLIDKPLRCLP